MTTQGPGGGTPPGWYPDPHGSGHRYWDGSQWTEQHAPAQQPPHPQQPQPQQQQQPQYAPPQKKGGSTVLKVMLGVVLGGLLLIGGCVALIGGAANEAEKELDKEQNENAITNKQARSVKLGTTRAEVEQEFGPPKSDQESTNEGLGDDTCIYYNVKGGEILDQWQFCFEGSGQSGKLRSKNRL
jgi:uncharacterized protein HemX